MLIIKTLKNVFSIISLAGFSAGIVNGLFGGGGGMILVPMLTACSELTDREIFPSSVAIIAPICIISLLFSPHIPLETAMPYMLGSAIGGLTAGLLGKKIPVPWLHKGLGLLIIWGGLRYLWQSF